MTIPYSVVVIKPLSIGRGDGPKILSDILTSAPVALRLFRSWRICDNSWKALSINKGLTESDIDYEVERIHAAKPIESWCLLFTHVDRVTDPTNVLIECCGPIEPFKQLPHHIRFRYGGMKRIGPTHHPSDTVMSISVPETAEYRALILFENFNPETI